MILLVAGGVLFPLVMWLVVAGQVRRRRRRARWKAEGVPGRALVTDLHTHASTAADGTAFTTYAPVLRYELPDGRVVEAESLERQNPPSGRPGQVVDIRYDARRPERPVVVDTAAVRYVSAMTITVFGVLAVVFTVVGALVVAGSVVAVQHGAPLWP